MKPIIISIILIMLLAPASLFAQQQGEHIILNTPLSGSECVFEASKSVSFLPGFSYKPQDNHEDLYAWINPYLIIPNDGNLEGGYPGGGTSGVVGSTSSQVSVSPSGAAVVSVPLPSPPGVAGMVPQLALVYSSQAGNGPFGYGWSLAGLSAISRTGKTIYHDGYTEGIRFEGTDNFVLDGQRLIATDEQGITYRTEFESFSKIKPIGQAGDGPESFLVKTRNFMTYRYGATESSRIEATGKNSVLSWLLSTVEDESGNYIEYQYIETNGYGYIDKIIYGGNRKTGQEHFCEIRFVYKTGRNDAMISFIAGSTIGIDKIAHKIEYYCEGQLLHSYELGSKTSNLYSLQSNIREINYIDNKKFCPVTLEHGANNHSVSKQVVERNGNTAFNTDDFFMDINGDGLTDIVSIEWERQNFGGIKHGKNWYYRLNQNNGTFSDKFNFGVLPNLLFKHLLVGDFNGDGMQDFVDIKYLNESQNRTIATRFFLSNGNGFDAYDLGNIIPINEYYSPEFRCGDFDGDGKDELFVLLKDLRVNCNFPASEAATVRIFRLETSFPYFQLVLEKSIDIGNKNISKSNVIVSDFTGNGRSDVLVTAEYCEKPDITNFLIYETNNLNNDLEVVVNNNDYSLTKSHQVFPGDFNRDGLTDLLTYQTAENDEPKWEIVLFTGRGGKFLYWDNLPLGKFDFENLFDQWGKMISISDYNGDGKSDVMKLEKSGIDNVFFKVYYSNGANFNETFTGTVQMQNGGFLSSFISERLFPFLDFNGDGKADLFSDNFNTFHLNLLDISNDYLEIKELTNGLGLKTEIIYHPLTKTPFYTKGTGAEFPLTDIQPALHAVSRITTKDPSNNEHYTTYQYEGLKLHKQGKGLLGFMKTTTQSFVNNNQISQSQNVNALNDEVYYFLWPKSAKTSVVKNGGQSIELLSETTNQVSEVKPFGDKRHFYYIARSLTKEWDLNGFVRSRLSTLHYSASDIQYGNITSEGSYVSPQQMSLGAPTAAYEFKTVNSFTYNTPDEQEWLISRPHEHNSQVWEKVDGNHIHAKTTYTYKPGSNLVETITALPDNDQSLLTKISYGYDDYGNIDYTKSEAPNADPPLPAMVTQYVFDPQYKHRFPTEETVTEDGIVYKTKFEYNAATGRLKKSTESNNLSTFYYYDGFGRQVRTLFPDKVQQQSQLYWADGHKFKPERALYYSWSQSSGMPPVLVFFDVLGRELRQVSIDFEGEAVFTDTHYTLQGNIDRVSLPYRSGSQPVFSYYQYDDLQRVTKVTLPDNTTAKTEYYPNSVKSINRLGQEAWKYFNAAGWLMRSEDNAGKSVEYMYFSDGKLKTANIVGQPATTIELTYNARRQRLSLSDPNYGTTLTHYDAYDRLTEQISPKQEATTFTYDGLGRMTSRRGPEGVTNWEYEIAPGRLGSLKSIVSETHQTTYTYDNMLRPTQLVDRIMDDEYTTNYTYDVYGRVKTTEYPTGYSLVSYYNEHGYFSHYREGGSNNIVWQALEMNALGQLNKFATGNGLQTTNTYYPGNARLHTVQTIAGQSTPIQDMEFGWDNLGNLDYRKKWLDRTNGLYLNESFGYDDLNRLETIHLNDKETGWHRYDEAGLGNMMEKIADNNYVFANGAYDGSRPHALTSAHVNSTLRAYTSDDQVIGWTSFDQPEYIEQGSKRIDFTYGHHRQRIRQLYRDENGETTKTFAGNCEFVSIDGQQYAYTYLSSPAGLFGIRVKRPDGTSELFYIHTDHLGSLHTITDENGSLLQELSFDAWGNSRDPSTWTFFDKNAETALFDRGFTGHEHLDGFQLINMNGRLYDPVVSRMLSPDNYVQSPDFSQSFNRYSYCFNNPLVYTDPDGEWVWLIPMAVGFATGYISHGATTGDWGWSAVGAGAIGAAVATIGFYSGGATSAASIAQGFSQVSAGHAATVALGYSGRYVASATFSSMMPSFDIPILDNVGISVSPGIVFGSEQIGVSLNVNASANIGDWTFNGGFGVNGYEKNFGPSGSSFGTKINYGFAYDDGQTGFAFYRTKYNSGTTSQTLGGISFRSGKFNLNYQNDWPTGDGGDRYRTAALRLGWQDFSLGFNLYTGDPGLKDRTVKVVEGQHTYVKGPYGDPDKYRAGILYAGYGNYQYGANSEGIRHTIQNKWIHNLIGSPHFKVLNNNRQSYFRLGTSNPYTLW